jgi:transcriptional regulator with XRE-family HTH domain
MVASRAQRGRERGLGLNRAVAREIRDARNSAGLSLAVVAAAAGISPTELSRVERGLAPWLSIELASRLCAIVGLELWLRTYPAGDAVRDAAHATLAADFRALIPNRIHLESEVPVGHRGDLRAWDLVADSGIVRAGVELETRVRDAQALARRVQLKMRDSGLRNCLIVIRDTHANRAAYQTARATLELLCPVSSAEVLAALRAGQLPAGSGLMFLPRPRTRGAAAGR